MTPARLEEVESAIAEQHRRFYGACRPESVDMAVELLAEVKRLREALGAMLAREDDTSITVSALDDQRIVDAARQALKETPW